MFYNIMRSGKLQDIGILLGSVPTAPVSSQDKKQLYKIYRYLNLIHILCYKSFMRDEFRKDDDMMFQYVIMGILNEEEGPHFASMGRKIREGAISITLNEIDNLLARSKKRNIVETKAIVLNEKICDLRGTMARLHDTFIRGE